MNYGSLVRRLGGKTGVRIWLLCLALLGLHAAYYYPFIADDALISLRYAERFLQGKGLTWNDGEYVEGYTNFLFVIATSLFGWFGMSLVLASRIVTTISAITIFTRCHLYAQQVGSTKNRWIVSVLVGLFLAASTPFAVWLVGGLENLMLGAFLALALPCIITFLDKGKTKSLDHAGIFLSLFLLCRADGSIVVAACTLGLVISMDDDFKSRIRAGFNLAIIPFMTFMLHLLFRVWYYGDLFPNTYYAKFALTETRFEEGAEYAFGFYALLAPLIGALLLWAFSTKWKMPKGAANRLGFMAIVLACYTLYICICGGDIFPAFRLMITAIVILAFILIEIANLLSRNTVRHFHYALLLFGLVGYLMLSTHHEHSKRAKEELWEIPCGKIGEAIHRKWAIENPTIAVTAAGCIPFYSKLPTLDMYGLNNKYIAKTRPEGFGHGLMGHELLNANYILSRRPEIIAFHIADSAVPREDFTGIPAFLQNYRHYSFRDAISGMTVHVWLRNDFYDRVTKP